MSQTLKERKAAYQRAYVLRHPERRKATQSKYYAKNSDAIRVRMKTKYAKQKASGTTYYQRNRELVKAKARERYHRKKAEREAQAVSETLETTETQAESALTEA